MKTPTDRNMKSPEISRRPGGFTLVEVLVVITITAVLAAIVMVMTQRIRSSAYQANALSSLRQVGVFHVGYASENSGDINTLRWPGDPKEGKPYVGNSFWGRFQSFLFTESPPTNQKQLATEIRERLNQLLNTTDADTMANTVIARSRIYHDSSGLPVPFSFNSNLHKWNEFIKINAFDDPSRVLYATYGFGIFNEQDGAAYEKRPVNGSQPKNNIYYLNDRKALASFLDGHVEMLSPPIPPRRFK